MYFITKRDSETGKKFQVVEKIYNESWDAQVAMSEKYGFKSWRFAPPAFMGTIVSCSGFSEKPNPKVWRKTHYGDNEFYPSKASKIGLAIIKDFDAIPKVSANDINMCIGFKGGPQRTLGVCFKNTEYIAFSADEDWKIIIPNDCEEITVTQFNQMFNKQKEKEGKVNI